MRKIRIKQDTRIIGVGTLPAGTEFKVEKFNSRFVYVRYIGCELRFSRSIVEKIY